MHKRQLISSFPVDGYTMCDTKSEMGKYILKQFKVEPTLSLLIIKVNHKNHDYEEVWEAGEKGNYAHRLYP